jgi:hypothetical protein
VEILARWWEKKFKLPSNHELFQSRTIHEHLVEYYLDIFESKPLEAYRGADGEIQFTNTGDDLVDRWEEQLAAGEIPDLYEAFDEAGRKKLQLLAKNKKSKGMTFAKAHDIMSKNRGNLKEGNTLPINTLNPLSEEAKEQLVDELFSKGRF